MRPTAMWVLVAFVAMFGHLSLGYASSLASPFRPPAIPLITTDPYMQSFIMGDNATSTDVRHWDQRSKEMLGLIRVDGTAYRYLGDCGFLPAPAGPADYYSGQDVAPGKCEITSVSTDNQTCNSMCYTDPQCKAFAMRSGTCFLKSCDSPLVKNHFTVSSGSVAAILTAPHPEPHKSCGELPSMLQESVSVMPTRTIFTLIDPKGRVELKVTFLSTLFTDDYARLSRPVSYIIHDIRSLDGQSHEVQMYTDASAQWAVDQTNEEVIWGNISQGHLTGTYLGTKAQRILDKAGDKLNINWGYLYLSDTSMDRSFDEPGVHHRAGSATDQRRTFVATGSLPSGVDTRMPRAASDDLPALAAVKDFGKVSHVAQRHSLLLAYDDVKSVRYYNEGEFSGYWTQTWKTIDEAMSAAAGELDEMLQKSVDHDADLMAKLTNVGGAEYAAVCALAYRQTLSATKLVWNSKRHTVWNFLKEISTNGDMQTMDVIYPASPMMLYTNPDLLKLLLVPVLSYANNETSTPFGNPYSPHQIGRYPIADATTQAQEPMPMENTGNMFLMLAGIVKRDPKHDTSFFYPHFWPVLKSWADFLSESLPYPANQLCTDDFTGRLANNTNLAAKGIVALEAFAHLCDAVKENGCDQYHRAAKQFAITWQTVALEGDHYKIAYNVSNSYSIKYNLVWQKLLDLDGPFDWNAVSSKEVKYYISKANSYGTPMDMRHQYVKLDWLSWAAAMADDDESFHALQDPIFAQAQATDCRVPLTDLFDTVTATCANGKQSFVDRPVTGGVFAKMLRDRGRHDSGIFV